MTNPSGTRPSPAATGTLADVPLAHALLYVRAKRLNGVFDLRAAGGRHAWIVFSRGRVVTVNTTPTVARFGTVVYELGYIDASTLDATTIESAASKRPQAELLLERGAITRDEQTSVLEEQVRRRVHHLFTYPPAASFFFREGRPSASAPEVHVDVLSPVWRGLVDFPPEARIASVLESVGDRPIRVVSEAALELAGFSGGEARLVDSMTTRARSLDELRADGHVPRARVDLLVYFLLLARCAEAEGPGRSPAASGAMWAVAAAPAARRSIPQSHPELPAGGVSQTFVSPAVARGPSELGVDGIRARAARIDDETPHETLGLPESATTEAVRAAYFRLTKLWHPDRIPPELAPALADIERVFAKMSDAHRVLTEPSLARVLR